MPCMLTTLTSYLSPSHLPFPHLLFCLLILLCDSSLLRVTCMTMAQSYLLGLGSSAEVIHLKTMIPPLPKSISRQQFRGKGHVWKSGSLQKSGFFFIVGYENTLKIILVKAHTFTPSAQKAEAGRSLRIQGQPRAAQWFKKKKFSWGQRELKG